MHQNNLNSKAYILSDNRHVLNSIGEFAGKTGRIFIFFN
jgi:hypothetical protein